MLDITLDLKLLKGDSPAHRKQHPHILRTLQESSKQ